MKSSDQLSVSSLLTLVVVITVTLLGYVSTYKVIAKSSEFACAKCDLANIHPFKMANMAPVCGACGEVFGHGYEHCCICHDYFFQKCKSALVK